MKRHSHEHGIQPSQKLFNMVHDIMQHEVSCHSVTVYSVTKELKLWHWTQIITANFEKTSENWAFQINQKIQLRWHYLNNMQLYRLD